MDRIAFKSAGVVRPKPLWKMTDAELDAIARSDDERADDAWAELEARAEDRRNPPEDTPSLDAPWWESR